MSASGPRGVSASGPKGVYPGMHWGDEFNRAEVFLISFFGKARDINYNDFISLLRTLYFQTVLYFINRLANNRFSLTIVKSRLTTAIACCVNLQNLLLRLSVVLVYRSVQSIAITCFVCEGEEPVYKLVHFHLVS